MIYANNALNYLLFLPLYLMQTVHSVCAICHLHPDKIQKVYHSYYHSHQLYHIFLHHTHLDHSTPPDYSYSTHTDSARPRGTHPPAQTFQSPDCKISPADNTARWSGHTAVPCRGFCCGTLPYCFGARQTHRTRTGFLSPRCFP